MLIENLYTIHSFTNQDGVVTATITINAAHNIFEGHFPGQPVLPGVCQLQIVKEMLERAVDKKLFLSEAGNCKFLNMVDPTKTAELTIRIAYNQVDSAISSDSVIKSGETTFSKINGLLATDA